MGRVSLLCNDAELFEEQGSWKVEGDKTGTLTLMEMMVVSAVTAKSAYQVTGDGYSPKGENKKDGKVAGKDPVVVLGNCGINYLAPERLKGRQGADFIGSHKPTVAGDIRRQFRC